MLRGFTRIIRQVRSMASEFTRGMQTMADEAELSDMKSALEEVKRGNLSGVADAIDPGGDLKDSVEKLKTSANETDLREEVGEIKHLASTASNSIDETATEPQSPDDPANKTAGSRGKMRS